MLPGKTTLMLSKLKDQTCRITLYFSNQPITLFPHMNINIKFTLKLFQQKLKNAVLETMCELAKHPHCF